MIKITGNLSIREDEIWYTTSKSGGPGGQNVNKLNTRVFLWFDLKESTSLNPDQKNIISKRLASRINKFGVLRVVCQIHRSQMRNKEEALLRFIDLISEALKEKPKRKKTRKPKKAVEKRLQNKKKRGEKKRVRGKVSW